MIKKYEHMILTKSTTRDIETTSPLYSELLEV